MYRGSDIMRPASIQSIFNKEIVRSEVDRQLLRNNSAQYCRVAPIEALEYQKAEATKLSE